MSFVITGLDPKEFEHLYDASDDVLAAQRVQRLTVDGPGFPDRITLTDLPVGASVLLLNYEHQPAETPYKSAHAIFVVERKDAEAARYVDAVPQAMRDRTISLRAFDAYGNMTDAALVEGTAIEPVIERMLADRAVAYLQAHYAVRGCYAARVERGPLH